MKERKDGVVEVEESDSTIGSQAKFTAKNAVCCHRRLLTHGVFDCDFHFDSHEWSCSERPNDRERTCGLAVKMSSSK